MGNIFEKFENSIFGELFRIFGNIREYSGIFGNIRGIIGKIWLSPNIRGIFSLFKNKF